MRTRAKDCAEPGPWSAVRRVLDDDLKNLARVVAEQLGVDRSLLLRKLLLHLPRFTWEELSNRALITNEAYRLAERITSLQRGYQTWIKRESVPELDRSRLSLRICDREIAKTIHERFHYIGHFHEGVVHLGLYLAGDTQDAPLALASLAPMDVSFLVRTFASPEQRGRVLQVTRVYAFNCAPRNTISFLFGRVSKWIRQHLTETSALLSYVNPNLGFSGSSYLASNWSPYLERPPVYSYLHEDYIPYRVFLSLSPSQRESVTHSKHCMDSLRLLRYPLGGPGHAAIEHLGARECRQTTA